MQYNAKVSWKTADKTPYYGERITVIVQESLKLEAFTTNHWNRCYVDHDTDHIKHAQEALGSQETGRWVLKAKGFAKYWQNQYDINNKGYWRCSLKENIIIESVLLACTIYRHTKISRIIPQPTACSMPNDKMISCFLHVESDINLMKKISIEVPWEWKESNKLRSM